MSVENLKFWYDKDGNKVYGDTRKYNKCFEYLMSNNPEDVLSKTGIRIRRIFHPLFTKLLPLTTKNKLKVVKRSTIPKDKPVIFALSHGFRDDIALGLKTIGKHAYLAYASLPDFYYSIDGLALWANGVYIIDRKDKSSKASLIPKIVKAHELGQKYHAICPEGVWNKDPNEVILNLWKGFYLASREIGAVVMPVVMLNKDMNIDNDENKTCYSALGEAVDLVKYADDITLDYLKQISFNGTTSQILGSVRKVHDAMVLNEKTTLKNLSNIIDFEKNKKEDVLIWLRNIKLGDKEQVCSETIKLLMKTSEPELYCDSEVIENINQIVLDYINKLIDLFFEHIFKLNASFSQIDELMRIVYDSVEIADTKTVEYFRCIMTFDKLDLMEKFSNARRKDIGCSYEYWDNYVKELIKTAHGLYDYSIENTAERRDNTIVSEADVFGFKSAYQKKKEYFE